MDFRGVLTLSVYTCVFCIWEVYTLVDRTKIGTSKMNCNSEKNACINRMWQLGFNFKANWTRYTLVISNRNEQKGRYKTKCVILWITYFGFKFLPNGTELDDKSITP